MKIAFLGLGRMGQILAEHLLDAGHDLVVWNRTPGVAPHLIAKGATAATSPGEAVSGANVVITVFFGPDAVREVVLNADLPFAPNTVWMDITTVAPHHASASAEWAASHGVSFVQSPVIGSLVSRVVSS
ncbi:NAD(P)-binding domain-containing protein [Galbitalea sp. SE-J8]|uniref:NAD(P)-binding domain-containing protein n=1 Tax=Galbitalea sp. SE-J8 TaxID=3054952 RepID=UPI00259CDED5|nr:NAD(P)-binding domain-containing protein [Galbitalea sp. SE-J8]MDM4764394.1 NAD(P)-binding domain-containing protein [Galbitalea sp. SE-J8]